MAMQTAQSIPPALAAIAAGRDHITTAEFARALNKAAQTVRKNFCLTGECYGIRPIKPAGSNGLLWPVAETAALLNGEAI
jgi:hypothetical protein